MKTRQILAERVRALMIKRGYSQSDVARLSRGAIRQRTVGRVLDAECDTKLSTVVALAKVLQVDVCQLLKCG